VDVPPNVLLGFVMTVVWLVCQFQPRRRGTIAVLFVLVQVVSSMPYLWFSLSTWLREPDNPMWFFNVVWFAAFAFLAVPVSLYVGTGGTRAQRLA
jgi:hypothetical protein